MMHISLFIPVLTYGGAEKVVISLANGLVEKGHKVDLVIIKREGALIKKVSPKVKLVELGANKTFLSIMKLRRYLTSSQPDVFLSGLDNANIVASIATRMANVNTKHFITLHTNLKQSYKHPRTIFHHFYPYLMRNLFRRADGFIAVSSCVAKNSGAFLNIPNDIIEVIYNPAIDKNMNEMALDAVEHPWLDDSSFFTIVAVGRIFEAKDYPMLLNAFNKVLSFIPNARLIILGDGNKTIKDEMARIISSGKMEHAIDIHGFVDNPYPFIKKASLFVLSSKWEGFGNVLVEALYLGTPVISTACECGPSEILKNGEFGTLVEVGDSDEMANSILDYIKNGKK
ncbi:glycosyltransferase [Sutcliffiella rhizosphaerae]|uniref:N-acetylgalactosamine-N, N'-diacetylbacillosaminyl-diphospho-undecaprenol 4-alpha-N-acetylgalactosaminyltransferase n=1 Tax=Sutcliffiella rhizosphaerae TaxID=2880967 RepID=A0ABM8YN74_9BACI|nr:glycosyltransferase [Sutcliffiella rhizosphaerae]CAG9621412.1 N-acetylgalactosamine-N, N'-diacetylbacillosaminyl-diphospho-undecaprenol 4-alpha-N-acetylgalactosaminyltransferase [Sutcliffiella rhizosphaerae]